MVFNTNILAGSGGQAGDDAFSPVGCKTNNVSIFQTAATRSYIFANPSAGAGVSQSDSLKVTDSKKFTIVFWFHPTVTAPTGSASQGSHTYAWTIANGTDTNGEQIASPYTFIMRRGDNTGDGNVYLWSQSGTGITNNLSQSNIWTVGEWNCYMISVDASTGKGTFFYNDDLKTSISRSVAFNFDNVRLAYIGAPTFVAGTHGTFIGAFAEYYYAPGQFVDFSIESNRRKFIDSEGKPVDLGADGSTPTGSSPLIYLSLREGEGAEQFAVNRGTGIDFTVRGSVSVFPTTVSVSI